MSNMFLLRKRRQPRNIRKGPGKIALNTIICLVVLVIILFLLIEFVLKPNMKIGYVEINYLDPAIPVTEQIADFAENLVGTPFNSAEPDALENAFKNLDEIKEAKVTRSWSGILKIELSPHLPVCILAFDGDALAEESMYIPVDSGGNPFHASKLYLDFFIPDTPIVEVSDLKTLIGQDNKVPEELLQAAELVKSLRVMDNFTYNLITKIKYYNNSKHSYASAYVHIANTDIEFQLSRNLQLKPFYAYITAVARQAEESGTVYSSVAVYNDTAICRL